MVIVRDKFLYLIPKNDYERSYLTALVKKRLTYNNPEHQVTKQKGNWYKIDKVPPIIETFHESMYKGEFCYRIQKGNKEIIDTILEDIQGVEKIDNRASYKIKCNLKILPRDDEQIKAINAITSFDFGYGILSSPPGSGKTYMASNIITRLKERTLVLVDQDLLLEQFMESILEFTDITKEEIGIIKSQTLEYDLDKKVILATMQTLVKKKDILEKLSTNIGFVIQDECQIASCETIREILKELRPKYILGLSGTPYRDDGFDFLIREMLGPIIYKTDKQAMIRDGSLIVPILRPIFLRDDEYFKKYIESKKDMEFRDVVDIYYNNSNIIFKISKFISNMMEDKSQLVICKEKSLVYKYHMQIMKHHYPELMEQYEEERIKTIKGLEQVINQSQDEKEIKQCKRKKLILEENILSKTFLSIKDTDEFKTVICLTAEISKSTRDKIISDTNKGITKVIITTTLMDKAISINRLDTLHLLFSTKEVVNTIQRVGRCGRASPGKMGATVFDYLYDHYIPFFQFNNKNKNCRMMAHNEACMIPNNIDVLIRFLQKRYMERDVNYTNNDYEQIKQFYEIDINK